MLLQVIPVKVNYNLSKQRMKRQVRGGLLIVSEIGETLRPFTRLVTERDMLHEKDYIAKITKAREDEDSMAFHRECRGDSTNLHKFTSREASLEEREILNCRIWYYWCKRETKRGATTNRPSFIAIFSFNN